MNRTVRTYEGKNNTYHFVTVSKTSYEEQQEQREELRYMIFQKAIGLIMTVLSIVMLCYGLAPAILLLLVGIAVILTKDHVVG